MSTEYVRRMFKHKCTYGSLENTLNLPMDHGVVFGSDDPQPMMNANDYLPNQHIIHCGLCKCPGNPMVMARCVQMQIVALVIPWPASLLMRVLIKLPEVVSVKCVPMTITPWINVKDTHLIEGAPALTLESELPCFYGGIISIVKPEEPEDAAEDSEEEGSETEQVLSRAQQIKHQVAQRMQKKAEIMMKTFDMPPPKTDAGGDQGANAPSGAGEASANETPAAGGEAPAEAPATPPVSPENKQEARNAIMSGAGESGAEAALQGESYEPVPMDEVFEPTEQPTETKELVAVQNEGLGRFISDEVSVNAESLAAGPIGDDIEELLSGEMGDVAIEQLTSYTIDVMAQGGKDAVMCIKSLQSIGLGSVVSNIADNMVTNIANNMTPPQVAAMPSAIKKGNINLA